MEALQFRYLQQPDREVHDMTNLDGTAIGTSGISQEETISYCDVPQGDLPHDMLQRQRENMPRTCSPLQKQKEQLITGSFSKISEACRVNIAHGDPAGLAGSRPTSQMGGRSILANCETRQNYKKTHIATSHGDNSIATISHGDRLAQTMQANTLSPQQCASEYKRAPDADSHGIEKVVLRNTQCRVIKRRNDFYNQTPPLPKKLPSVNIGQRDSAKMPRPTYTQFVDLDDIVAQKGFLIDDMAKQALTEDANFRIRSIICKAHTFTRQAACRKMRVSNVQKAMHFMKVPPLYGNGCNMVMDASDMKSNQKSCGPLGLHHGLAHVAGANNASLCQMNVVSMAKEKSAPICLRQDHIQANWMAVHGQPCNLTEIVSKADGKQSKRTSKLMGAKRKYFEESIRAITGQEVEVMRKSLLDLRRNICIRSLVPFYKNFVQRLERGNNNYADLMCILHTLKAMLLNKTFYLSPYINWFAKLLTNSLLSPSLCPESDHWAVRDRAAQLLPLLIREKPTHWQLRKCVASSLAGKSWASSPCVQYGCVVGLHQLGVQVLQDVLLPLVERCSATEGSARSSITFSLDVNRVHGALLLAASYLMSCFCHQESESSRETHKGVALQSCMNVVTKNYLQLAEHFGDSLCARLPLLTVPPPPPLPAHSPPAFIPPLFTFQDADSDHSDESPPEDIPDDDFFYDEDEEDSKKEEYTISRVTTGTRIKLTISKTQSAQAKRARRKQSLATLKTFDEHFENWPRMERTCRSRNAAVFHFAYQGASSVPMEKLRKAKQSEITPCVFCPSRYFLLSCRRSSKVGPRKLASADKRIRMLASSAGLYSFL